MNANETARGLARRAARLPWQATARLPWVAQRRIKFLLGDPPLGPDGVWLAVDPYAAYGQRPSKELIELVVDAARRASDLHPTELIDRATARSPFAEWVDVFPGEHYRLLAALTAVVEPRLIVEIGTYTGASALAFLDQAGAGCQVVTYDVLAWDEIPGTLLRAADFDGGRLEQRVVDVADPEHWRAELATFRDADLIFLDGPKDGVFEPLMMARLAGLARETDFVLVIDDIRFLEMIEAWASFPAPKLDATSFGHWSGTGIALC